MPESMASYRHTKIWWHGVPSMEMCNICTSWQLLPAQGPTHCKVLSRCSNRHQMHSASGWIPKPQWGTHQAFCWWSASARRLFLEEELLLLLIVSSSLSPGAAATARFHARGLTCSCASALPLRQRVPRTSSDNRKQF
jgi:hypothetical protein